jgi:hypothetical protein
MSKAQLVTTAVAREGRSKSEVARDYDLSRQWVRQLVTRYKTDGAVAFQPRSGRPHTNARAISAALETRRGGHVPGRIRPLGHPDLGAHRHSAPSSAPHHGAADAPPCKSPSASSASTTSAPARITYRPAEKSVKTYRRCCTGSG